MVTETLVPGCGGIQGWWRIGRKEEERVPDSSGPTMVALVAVVFRWQKKPILTSVLASISQACSICFELP